MKTLSKRGYRFISLSFASALLIGCASSNSFVPDKDIDRPPVKTFESSDTTSFDEIKYLSSAANDNVFKIGDMTKVTVHGFEEFSGNFSVDKNGRVYFAHIGYITVSGKTIAELQTELREQYSTCCLRNPSVSVEKETEAIGKIVVDGAVDSPGAFDVFETVRLTEAIAIAGGMGENANKNRTILSRDFDGERRIMLLDLEEIQLYGGNDPKYTLGMSFLLKIMKGNCFTKIS